MKKILFILAITLFLSACSEQITQTAIKNDNTNAWQEDETERFQYTVNYINDDYCEDSITVSPLENDAEIKIQTAINCHTELNVDSIVTRDDMNNSLFVDAIETGVKTKCGHKCAEIIIIAKDRSDLSAEYVNFSKQDNTE